MLGPHTNWHGAAVNRPRGNPTDAELVAAVNDAVRGGDLDRVVAGLTDLLKRHPANPVLRQRLAMALNNRGSRNARQGALHAAETDFRAALALVADHAEAEVNLARLLAAAKRWDAALIALEQACSRFPHDIELRLDLAEAMASAGAAGAEALLDEAIAVARSTGQIDPTRLAMSLATRGRPGQAVEVLAGADRDHGFPARAARVADKLCESSAWRAARAAYAIAAAAGGHGRSSPSLRAVLGERLALPFIHASCAEVEEARKRFAGGLDELVADYTPTRLAQCEPDLVQLAWTQQMLAYQGRNDRDLLARWGDWLDSALRVFAPRLAEAPDRRANTDPREIAIVSAKLGAGVVGDYFRPWIEGLATAGFKVTAYLVDPPDDEVVGRLRALASRTVCLVGSIEAMATVVRDARHSAIIYPDVGIDARTTLLAALRLAPRQYAAWGHPETTGLPSIDGYFSCAEMEPENAATHYRERLLLLPGAGTRFDDPGPVRTVTRDVFGLGPSDRVHLLPHVPPKIHPDCDPVLASIAAADPRAVLVLFDHERREISEGIRRRLADALIAAGADPGRQLRLLPKLPRAGFLGLCRIADTMIDTLHWSGGANSLDALSTGLPVIACPGSLMRGRQTLGLLHGIDLAAGLIAPDPTTMVEIATTVAADHARRSRLGAELAEHARFLRQDARPLQALAQHLSVELDLA